MNSSTRGPQGRNDAPFVMHLERVCRLIEMGQRFAVEFNPCSDVATAMHGRLVRDVALEILAGGEIAMRTMDGSVVLRFDMTLANYKRLWRCWQNGTPGEAQRRTTRWG